MIKKVFVCTAVLFLAAPVMAGPKEDFVSAVKAQCGKSDAEAAGLATPGRTGTVFKFKLCSSPKVDVGGGCTVTCSKAGATIGN